MATKKTDMVEETYTAPPAVYEPTVYEPEAVPADAVVVDPADTNPKSVESDSYGSVTANTKEVLDLKTRRQEALTQGDNAKVDELNTLIMAKQAGVFAMQIAAAKQIEAQKKK